MVYEPDYDSPKSPGDSSGPGESKDNRHWDQEACPEQPETEKVEYVNSMDEMFPPGPEARSVERKTAPVATPISAASEGTSAACNLRQEHSS